MGTRTPVYIYAADPLSAAGAKAQLIFEPAIELVGPMDLDRARVALVVADAIDDGVGRIAKAIQRDGVPHVVAVASHFDEIGVLEAVAAGVVGFLRRTEATTARLVEMIVGVDEAGNLLPEGLRKRAASVQYHGSSSSASLVLDVPRTTASEVRKRDGAQVTLSSRESEILRLVADGYDTTEVADQLSYSESTIKGVLTKAMVKLEARNRCHAVALALRSGLI